MSPKEITTMLGEAWRKMSEAEKKVRNDFIAIFTLKQDTSCLRV
jgi:hypothetical protein